MRHTFAPIRCTQTHTFSDQCGSNKLFTMCNKNQWHSSLMIGVWDMSEESLKKEPLHTQNNLRVTQWVGHKIVAQPLLLLLMTIGHKAGHYCHFQCMLNYFLVSIVHRTLTVTTGSLTCICALFACAYTWGTSVYNYTL